jgi:DNA-binding transcriptional MerR regulator
MPSGSPVPSVQLSSQTGRQSALSGQPGHGRNSQRWCDVGNSAPASRHAGTGASRVEVALEAARGSAPDRLTLTSRQGARCGHEPLDRPGVEDLRGDGRTLYHYDEIGLLRPSARTEAGYRRYSTGDLERLQAVLFYRELGFSLDEIRTILDDTTVDPLEYLSRQKELLTGRIRGLSEWSPRWRGRWTHGDLSLEAAHQLQPQTGSRYPPHRRPAASAPRRARGPRRLAPQCRSALWRMPPPGLTHQRWKGWANGPCSSARPDAGTTYRMAWEVISRTEVVVWAYGPHEGFYRKLARRAKQ